jgi:uncharacterized membrane protein
MPHSLKDIFSRLDVNTGRQVNLDLAKVIAIVFMILSHPFEYTGASISKGVPYFITFIGAHQFAAPVFMMCMGIGFTYWHHRKDPAAMCRRGFRLFLTAYALNLFRALGVLVAGVASGKGYLTGWAVGEVVLIDILQFAGLSAMVLGLLLRLRLPYWSILLMAVAMSLGGSCIHMATTGHYLSDAVLGLFAGIRGEDVESYFPLLNWFVFVVAGYGMGRWLRRCRDKDRLYLILTPVATMIYLGYTLYAAPRGIGMFDTSSVLHFYHTRTWDALICINAFLMSAGICHFLLRSAPRSITAQVTRCASDVLRIYLLQWFFVIWVLFCLMEHILGIHFTLLTTILSGIFITVASILLARVKPFSKFKI